MLIGKIVLDEAKITGLIHNILQRKTLQDLNKDFVRDELFKYLQKNHQLVSKLNSNFQSKSSIYKKVLKEVRQQLRRVYGLYRTTIERDNREELIQQLSSDKNFKTTITKILQTHSSTKERLDFYAKLYSNIFKITKAPTSILDLGCGLNPFSIPLMDLNKLNYYAYDLSKEEINSLNTFFQFLEENNDGFWGVAKVLDAFSWEEIAKHDPVDLCFLFKMTDVLDRGRGHKVSEEVINRIPAKYVVVSFSTKTMSGKGMNFPERKWIELMCTRLKYTYKPLKFSNEIFYVIKK